MKQALMALEDGRTFKCQSFTGPCEAFGEIVFNTGMTGYQEVLTDPSYRGQLVTMTYPLVGNYGVNPADMESERIQVTAFLVREYQPFYSNHQATQSLADNLIASGIPGIDNFDTRALTRHIRMSGAMRAAISTQDLDPSSLIERVKEHPTMNGQDLAKEVSTLVPYRWHNNQPVYEPLTLDASVWKDPKNYHCVVVFDFGIKYNILRMLESHGCEIIVVPAQTSSSVVQAMAPDGIFLSNGPGDPAPVTYAIQAVRDLLDYRPIFGICLGHQILALALGAKTYKLKFGHRGINQPVRHFATEHIEITSQNHGFAVNQDCLQDCGLKVTHMNLNDNTIEGFQHHKLPLFAVQYHPEASPGPHDSRYLFEQFVDLMT
ncbi:MAG: Carbamoyl-phosphate synthase small chain [Candidatus Magnetoglobus multicellularis str. Araruama]|uniref:Carbamoyl phosphate synthase small chain n=1 Tax=Candidatus Magnetoglobus multicellularis str. Araruama TaxID=890399 RepID=A0A1V1P570_9BACT|nr:MAG: Carbamoyl-phosphate synthase small chain [Candidatus Magnetoglobus multicellularis str. Araruama]